MATESWPFEREFCQGPWKRIFHEKGSGVLGGVGWGGVLGGVLGGEERWSPRAMAWGQNEPSRWLAAQEHFASNQVGVLATTVVR